MTLRYQYCIDIDQLISADLVPLRRALKPRYHATAQNLIISLKVVNYGCQNLTTGRLADEKHAVVLYELFPSLFTEKKQEE